jgi:hypothetical protein
MLKLISKRCNRTAAVEVQKNEILDVVINIKTAAAAYCSWRRRRRGRTAGHVCKQGLEGLEVFLRFFLKRPSNWKVFF